MPHVTRSGLAECLRPGAGAHPVVSRMLAAASGIISGIVLPEGGLTVLANMRSGKSCAGRRAPPRASTRVPKRREHHYKITVYAERDGRLRESIEKRPSIKALTPSFFFFFYYPFRRDLKQAGSRASDRTPI